MIKKYMVMVGTLLLTYGPAQAQGVEDLLMCVERNNVTLKAQRKLQEAKSIGARVGNSLANPTVSYDLMIGGAPGQESKQGELSISQELDLPWAYADRNSLAREKSAMYGYEYSVARTQILVQAKQTYITLAYLNKIRYLQQKRLSQVKNVADDLSKRLSSGDANIIEKSRADMELITMQQTVERTESEIKSTMNQITALNGGEPIALSDQALNDYLCAEVLPFEDALKIYSEHDPQLKALSSAISVAQQQVKVDRNESLPKLVLGYRYDYAPGENFNGVMMGVTVPMFGNRYNVKRAKAEQQYATTELESSRINLQSALQSLYDRRSSLKKTMDSFSAIDDNHTQLLTKALNEGQISITEFYAQMNTYYTLFEEYAAVVRDFNMVCTEINAINL